MGNDFQSWKWIWRYLDGQTAFGQRVESDLCECFRLDGLELLAEDFDVAEFGCSVQGGDVIELGRENGTANFDAQTPQSVEPFEQLWHGRRWPGLDLQLGQVGERMERIRFDGFENGQWLQNQMLEPREASENVAIQRSDRIVRQIQLLEQRSGRPQEMRHLGQTVARQVQVSQPVQPDDYVVDAGWFRRRTGVECVHRQIQRDEVRQRQMRPPGQADVGQVELLDPLHVVEQFLEVGP